MTQHQIAVPVRPIEIPLGRVTLRGDLALPPDTRSIVLFAHGSGSSRFSPRNRFVASQLNEAGIATLLMDLLTPEEEAEDIPTGHIRFNINLLSDRLTAATDWINRQPETRDLNIGLFGASTGAGAAVITASQRPQLVKALVSRGGRPDMAARQIQDLNCPTLLIVGGNDGVVIDLNRRAFNEIPSATDKELKIIPGASHLFEEPGTLEAVACHAADWFKRYLR